MGFILTSLIKKINFIKQIKTVKSQIEHISDIC